MRTEPTHGEDHNLHRFYRCGAGGPRRAFFEGSTDGVLGHDVEIIDAFKESGKVLNTVAEQGYKQLVERLQLDLYRKMYNAFDEYSKVYEVVFFSSAKKIMQKDLLPDIERIHPDLIVSTHPIVTNVLGQP